MSYFKAIVIFLLICMGSGSKNQDDIGKKVLQEAMLHLGKPYGQAQLNYDCSGFVQFCFSQLDVKIPRSSRAQSSAFTSLKKKDVRPGDLIFFTGRNAESTRVGHVGIVTEINEEETLFIHASNSEGVVISGTSQPYYRDRFLHYRRVK